MNSYKKEWERVIVNGVCMNGCLPMDASAQVVQDRLVESAVSIEFQWEHKSSMPVIKWDRDFDKWLNERTEVADGMAENNQCLLPWRILECLPEEKKTSDRLYWSQGPQDSCMSHSNTFAYQCSTLIEMAFGAPLKYHSFNPIVPYYLCRGGSMVGGRTVSEMADWTNRYGQYPEDWVGTDNQSVPDYKPFEKQALEYQNGLVFIEKDDAEDIAEAMIRGCHAGLAFSYGNSHAISGVKYDKNGVKVAVLGGRWAHATSISSWRKVGKTEYVFWQNSHGPQYDQSDEGEPADGAWMDYDTLCRFVRSIPDYGYPYAHFIEGEITNEKQFNPLFTVPFPANWER